MTDDYAFNADLAIADTEIERLRSENELLKKSFDASVQSVRLRDTTIKGFHAALELANEKCAECDYKLKAFLHNENTYTNCMPDFLYEIASLKQTVVDREGEIADLKFAMANTEAQAKELVRGESTSHLSLLEKITDRDRRIASLEHELNDARLLHLEQLEAIVDMLQPLADNKVGWVNDWSVGALKLAITVIQNNINELSD